MKKIRIAQIGTGHDHAGVTFAALKRMTDVFEVVGYAQVPEDRGVFQSECYEGAKRYPVEEILAMPDLDAVAVETFDLALVPYAQKAADRGLNVQMDKAPGESAEAYEKLLSTIKEKKLKCEVYFADPYCAWQKGTNENSNGLLREFYPKGRNLSHVGEKTLKKNLALINARPKKVLGYKAPADLFE